MIAQGKVQTYWRDRAAKHGKLAVGYRNSPAAKQSAIHTLNTDFIFGVCPVDLYTLDFGCGIGKYAQNFEKYVGCDVTEQLISTAKEENPGKAFHLLRKPHINEGENRFSKVELVFTATVLQHNSDAGVNKILDSFRHVTKNRFVLALYENSTCATSPHMKGRQSAYYRDFVSRHYDIESFMHVTHVVARENHTLTLLVVTK